MPKLEAAERRDKKRDKARRMPVHGKSIFTVAEARAKREAKLIRRIKGRE